ncbi:MAG TPA: mechanosensitive ion channel domain-containing protein [Afifellaceae bacterium]|nr:mechanosensitive ion channel domain-containing protein [Afifellaceae bacterium]
MSLSFFEYLFRDWTLIQLAVIAGSVVIAMLIGRLVEPRLEMRVRAIHGKPRLLRFLAIVLRRTNWIMISLCLWGAVHVMRALTWPSRSYLVGLAAYLVTAWVVISILSRLIRNRSVARLVALLAWIFVALRATGTLDDMSAVLDAAAVTVGEMRISILLLVKMAIVLGALLWTAISLGGFVERQIASSDDLTPTVRVLLGKLVKILLVIFAIAIALTSVGVDLTALTVFSGAVGVGIGFGLQKVVSNFISGIIILMDKSIKPGDTIALGDTFGWIRSLRARFVSVVTRDGREYLIPNEDFITQQVVNWSFTDRLIRLDVHFGVSYDSNPHEVRKLAVEAAASVERVRDRPPPVCHLTAFGDSSLDFILRFWIQDPQGGLTNIRGAVLLACWDAFKEAGVSIPFPHREIIMRTPVDVQMPD